MKKSNKKRGSEATQFVLLTAISAIIVISVLFPSIKSLTTTTTNKVETWFNDNIDSVFNTESDVVE